MGVFDSSLTRKYTSVKPVSSCLAQPGKTDFMKFRKEEKKLKKKEGLTRMTVVVGE